MSIDIPLRRVDNEEAARRYLRGFCWSGCPCFCPRCGSQKVYRLGSGRRRCPECRYTFSEFAGRWLSRSRLSCNDWILLVRLFEAECSPEEIAQLLGRAYATAFHAVTVVRTGILAHCDDSGVLVVNSQGLVRMCCHRGSKALRADGHVPVFGIREQHGSVVVSVIPGVGPDAVLEMPVKKIRRGNLVYTGQVEDYDALLFCAADGHCGLSRVRFARSPAYIDGASAFWAFALPRLAAHRGVSPAHFPLYLKELEFRYNHRGEDLTPLLLRYLCDFVPLTRSH